MNMSRLNGTHEDETCLSRLSFSSQEDVNGTDTSLSSKDCSVIWDGFNCWGPAQPGSTVYLACPAAKGMDVSKHAYRTCSLTGQWLNKDGFPDEKGWTNYTPCFTPEIMDLLNRLYSGTESEAMSKIDIARRTRILELVGLSLSLAALLLSLFIFYYFRSLRNPRTRLHRHLFFAVVIQVAVRLTLYIDQFIVRSNLDEKTSPETQQDARGIDNTPILCEAAYICLEYARTSMFMWMFVEGLYLHNMITVTVFEEKLSPAVYRIVGWVFPIPLTLAWAVVTAKQYGTATCWWGYNFTLYFWILEGPRLGVLMVNLAFLLNILRVLVTKLRQSNSSEAHQARKAVKAALVLLPLLGLTNLLNMLDAPLERSALEFGLWSYTTHALTSCQGLILAWLYCFWNGEVQLALKKFVRYKILNNRKHNGLSSKYPRGSIRLSLMNNSNAVTHGGAIIGPVVHRVDFSPDSRKNQIANNNLTLLNTSNNTNLSSVASTNHNNLIVRNESLKSGKMISKIPLLDLNSAPLTIPLTMNISPCRRQCGGGSLRRVIQVDTVVDFDSNSSSSSSSNNQIPLKDSLSDNNSGNFSKSDSDLLTTNSNNFNSNGSVSPKKQRRATTAKFIRGKTLLRNSEAEKSSGGSETNIHGNSNSNSNSISNSQSGHKLRRLSKLKIWISPFVLVSEGERDRSNSCGKNFLNKKLNLVADPPVPVSLENGTGIVSGPAFATTTISSSHGNNNCIMQYNVKDVVQDEDSSEMTSADGCDFKFEMTEDVQVI